MDHENLAETMDFPPGFLHSQCRNVPSYIKTGKVTEATEDGPPAVKAGKLAMFM